MQLMRENATSENVLARENRSPVPWRQAVSALTAALASVRREPLASTGLRATKRPQRCLIAALGVGEGAGMAGIGTD